MNSITLSKGLLSSLDHVRFATGGSRHETKERTERYVREHWNKGTLPFEVREGVWLVGWRVYKTFFGAHIEPITVGPAKPTKCRHRHFNDVSVSTGW